MRLDRAMIGQYTAYGLIEQPFQSLHMESGIGNKHINLQLDSIKLQTAKHNKLGNLFTN